MLSIKSLVFTVLICFNIFSLGFAESDISNVTLSKSEVNKSLDMLQAQGSFTAEEINKAREALDKMDSQAFDSLTAKAHDVIKNDPKTAKKMAKIIGE